MTRSFVIPAVLVLLLGIALVPAGASNQGGEKKAADTRLDSPYFPLKVGTTWEYLSGPKKAIVKVAAHEELDGVLCARLETELGPSAKVTEHLTVKQDGIYRVRANNQEIKPPLLVLKVDANQQPLKSGDGWSWDSTIQNFTLKGKFTRGEEKLTVGKEEYATISVKSSDLKMGEQAVSMETWYAMDVGMVKQHFKLPAAELDVVLELEKFTAGK